MKKNEIIRSYGTDFKEMTKRLLDAAKLYEDIKEKVSGKDSGDIHIGIKPNLVTPSPASFGATTHPEIVAGTIEYLKEKGLDNITVAEGSWVGDRTEEAFEYCGYNALASQYGVRLLDTKTDSSYAVITHIPGTGRSACPESEIKLKICSCVREFDYLINIPVLKGHCQTHMTCSLKNMKGLIPDSEKRRFHTLGLHKPIALLNTCIHQDFIIIDHICGDPDFEEGGDPLIRNCVMAAKDPVLADVFGCSLLGVDVNTVKYIGIAEQLGVGCGDLNRLLLKTLEGDPSEDTYDNESVLDVNYAVDEYDSCSACYASLIPALEKLRSEGLLDRLDCRIGIGQGHQGKNGKIGVGKCTSGFDFYVKGCPPETDKIYEELKKHILENW